jgi:hypothetical protein
MSRLLLLVLVLALWMTAGGCSSKKSDEPVKKTESFMSRDRMPRPSGK